MARWVVYENRNGNLNVNYQNLQTGQVHQAGEVRRDTPHRMLVEWIVNQGEPNPGDLIRFDDGTTLFIYPHWAQA